MALKANHFIIPQLWTKVFDGYIQGPWRIRGPLGIGGKKLYWIYYGYNGKRSRYTTTGHFEHVVSFGSLTEAKQFVQDEIIRTARKGE